MNHIDIAERAAFETAANSLPYQKFDFTLFALGTLGEGARTYLDVVTESAWLLWIAARGQQPGGKISSIRSCDEPTESLQTLRSGTDEQHGHRTTAAEVKPRWLGKHSPLPWRITDANLKKSREIVAADGSTVAKLTALDITNAEIIVESVNAAHQQMATAADSMPKALADAYSVLLSAADAVIARWETPKWKDEAPTATFIYNMRDAANAVRAIAGAESLQPQETCQAREEWSYSTDENRYYGEEPSKLAILRYALGQIAQSSEPVDRFFVGRNVRFVPRGLANAVIEFLREQAFEECGEYAETYLENVSGVDKRHLSEYITAWAQRANRSNFWTVTDVEPITVDSARALVTAHDVNGVA